MLSKIYDNRSSVKNGIKYEPKGCTPSGGLLRLHGCRFNQPISTAQQCQFLAEHSALCAYSNFQDDHTPFEETGINVQGLIRAEEIVG